MKNNLKKIRVRQNMTQWDLANLASVSKSHISDIENNKAVPTLEIVCRLAKSLNVDTSEIFSCE